jgi:hypothetical protein
MPNITVFVSAADATVLQAAYPSQTAQEILDMLVSRDVTAVEKRVSEAARNAILLAILSLTPEQLTLVKQRIDQFVANL